MANGGKYGILGRKNPKGAKTMETKTPNRYRTETALTVILLVCTAATMKYSNRNVNYDS